MLTLAAVGLTALVGITGASADEPPAAAAPTDPTRNQWDSFLDPVRDVEDQLTGYQKSFEDYSKIHIGAGIDTFWEWNFNDPSTGFNTLRSLDPDHAMANVNLAQIRINRPSDGWFIPGFGLTLDAGRIAKFIKSDWGGTPGVARGDTFEHSDTDAEEAYLTWAVPDDGPSILKGLSLKGGKFATLLGAEVIEPWANYNLSRSFLFGFAIPFTNTGVLASYPITDKLSVTMGPVAGWDKVTGLNGGWSFMGDITWVTTDQLTLAANWIWGPETKQLDNKRTVVDLIATIKATDALTFVLNYDVGTEEAANVASGLNNNATWQGFAAIANYNFTDRASAAARGEWFQDQGGSRTGLRQGLWEATLTGKYLITQHLYTRAEYRHDESSKQPFFADSNKLLAGQDTIGFEFGYVFN
jgi:hypothetical protein